MEESDYKALDHPGEYILDKGGHIYMAVYKGETVRRLRPHPNGGWRF